MGAFEDGRDNQAGQMYAREHYGWIMFKRRVSFWGPIFVIAFVIVVSLLS